MSGGDAEVVAMAARRVERRMDKVHAKRHPKQECEQNGSALALKSATCGGRVHLASHWSAGRTGHIP